MKKATLFKQFGLLLAMLALFQCALIGQTLKEFFNDNSIPLLYLGIDFTRTRLIDDNTANVEDLRERQYGGINDVIIDEAKKYDVKAAFHRNTMDHDLGTVMKRNQAVNANQIKSTNTSDFHRLNQDSIAALVNGFDFGTKKGIGLLIVMEALSKSEKSCAAWVTFVDMGSKKMLATERMEGKGSMAFGFRNYWAATVKSVIESIEKKKYNEWKTKYGS